ncbi:MAG: AMP-binding protein, partial [Acidimicrobiales bacterium]|nr:AMP-binding protein [Acidimicrobiales bacterium]
NVVLGAALRSGATVVLSDRFDVADALRSVRRHGVTTLVGPPAMWAALAEAPAEFDADALATVRLALAGAAPLDPGIARRIEQRYGVSVRQGYGLTEMSPVVSLASPSCPVSSVGTPLPGVEIRLVDEDAADVLVDDVGEVWVRGPNLFSGYLGDDAATAEVLTADGWLRTGDLGVVDRGGRLTIVGRLKDLIVVSGFNVYPAEVEEALVTHQGVVSAAVVGEPDPRTGERVVAHVVTAPGAGVTDDDLRDHVAARLAGYKVPAQFIRVGDLPVGVAGKLRRRELRGQSNVEEGR